MPRLIVAMLQHSEALRPHLKLLRGLSPNWRCGASRAGCAFQNGSSDDDVVQLRSNFRWRHALIISEPGRYERAAAEALLGGFIPTMIPSIKRKQSACIPKANWSDPTEQSLVKLENVLRAFQHGLAHILKTGVPHAIFEDDIVLATSRAKVQDWLDSPSPTLRRVDCGSKNCSKSQAFARSEFDFVPLGSCGVHYNHGCGHASWFTPAGARRALAFWRAGLISCKKSNFVFDLGFYINAKYPKGGVMCSSTCAPNRTLAPDCTDWQAKQVVSNRRICLDGRDAQPDCDKGEALRCVDWREQKRVATLQGARFSRTRYKGYGHFVQDIVGVKPTMTAGTGTRSKIAIVSNDDPAFT